MRLATPITSDDYVTGKLWLRATLSGCPWHPRGGCGFARHGTYERVSTPGAFIARWYCPTARHTVSALPECLASHRTGTLAECEATLCRLESAGSLAAAAQVLRTDIELPGALRFLTRLKRRVGAALIAIRGLLPERFADAEPTIAGFAACLGIAPGTVLMTLRHVAWRHLAHLPTPLGSDPRRLDSSRIACTGRPYGRQHRAGRDPPVAIVESPVLTRDHETRAS